MKKILLATAAVVAFSSGNAFADYSFGDSIYLGVRGGLALLAPGKTTVNQKIASRSTPSTGMTGAGTPTDTALMSGSYDLKLKNKNNSGFIGLSVGTSVMEKLRVGLSFDHYFASNSKEKKVLYTAPVAGTSYGVSAKVKNDANALFLDAAFDVYDFADTVTLFVHAGVGMSMVSGKTTLTALQQTVSGTTTTVTEIHTVPVKLKSKSNFAYSAGVGAAVKLVDGVSLELSYAYRDLGSAKNGKFDTSKITVAGVPANSTATPPVPGTAETKLLNSGTVKAKRVSGHQVIAGIRFEI